MLASYSDFKFPQDSTIMEASRIILERASQPYRIVLRKLNEKEYVTHLETLGLEGDTWKHTAFFHGHYYNASSDSKEDKDKALTQAIEDFKERIEKM